MKYFKILEFECPCCQKGGMEQYLLDKLDIARDMAGIPFKINSAYRCERHNAIVGGSATSSHKLGWAVDIACHSGVPRFKIINALIRVGFTRIGIYSTFIHADLDPNKQAGVIWYK